jgi:hypothetical protein
LFTQYAESMLKMDSARAGVRLVLAKDVPLQTLVNKANELIEN